MKRRANKVDENHAEIREALRLAGALVKDCSHIGQGWPDLLVSHRGEVHMVEIKQDKYRNKPLDKVLTKDQIEFHATQEAHGVHVHVVYDIDDALSVIGARRVG